MKGSVAFAPALALALAGSAAGDPLWELTSPRPDQFEARYCEIVDDGLLGGLQP